MMRFTLRQSGSSLLIVVVSMAAISSLMLAGSATLLASMRQRSVSDDSRRANQGVDLAMESAMQSYGAMPAVGDRRAFAISKEQGYTGNCGNACAASAVIRNSVSLAQNERYTLTTRELPHEIPIWLDISANVGSSLTFTLKDATLGATAPKFTGFDYQACFVIPGNPEDCSTATEGYNGVGVSSFTLPAGLPDRSWTAVRLTLHYRVDSNGLIPFTSHIPAIEVVNPGTAPVRISKGFTLVEGSGNAPDGSVHTLMTIRPYDRAQPNDLAGANGLSYRPLKTYRPNAQNFDSKGYCHPSYDIWLSKTQFNPDLYGTPLNPQDPRVVGWPGRDDCR